MSPAPPLERSLSGGSRLIDQGGGQRLGLDHEPLLRAAIPLPGLAPIASVNADRQERALQSVVRSYALCGR
jgi:hypothetical protein